MAVGWQRMGEMFRHIDELGHEIYISSDKKRAVQAAPFACRKMIGHDNGDGTITFVSEPGYYSHDDKSLEDWIEGKENG